MSRIVECVPNFSEGRRRDAVEAIATALTGVRGVALLDLEMDAAHNRSVITIAGEPGAVAEGVLAGVGEAVRRIDLRSHRGEHPRMGAADVIPFVPVSGVTMEECVELSVRVAAEIARQYSVPVYLYEQSARTEARRDLAAVRKGGFEGIRELIATDPERRPDFGPLAVHPSAGATAVGARFPLIAYNVYLHTQDLTVAQAVARAVRHSSGGLRYVKALGFEIKERSQVQVSMNLTNYEATPIHRAFEMVVREAGRYGVAAASSEIVGLVPQKALHAAADYFLRLEGFSENQILENRLSAALAGEPRLGEFVDQVAAAEAVPGGGRAAALAGSRAAALGQMVAGLTAGKRSMSRSKPVWSSCGRNWPGLARSWETWCGKTRTPTAASCGLYACPGRRRRKSSPARMLSALPTAVLPRCRSAPCGPLSRFSATSRNWRASAMQMRAATPPPALSSHSRPSREDSTTS